MISQELHFNLPSSSSAFPTASNLLFSGLSPFQLAPLIIAPFYSPKNSHGATKGKDIDEEEKEIDGPSQTIVNWQDLQGRSPLLTACYWNNYQVIETLLQHPRINLNLPDTHGLTPFYYACAQDSKTAVLIMLNDPRVDVRCYNDENWSPLMRAACYGNLQVVKYLLASERTLDLDQRSSKDKLVMFTKYPKGSTAYDLANISGHSNIAFLLQDFIKLKGHVQEKIRREFGWKESAPFEKFVYACADGDEKLVRELLPRIDPNKPFVSGKTALWYAVYKNNVKIVQILVSDPRISFDASTIAAEISSVFSKLNKAAKLIIENSSKKPIDLDGSSINHSIDEAESTRQANNDYSLQILKEELDELTLVREKDRREIEQLKLNLQLQAPSSFSSSLIFPFEDIKIATDNFNPLFKIGEGGCGEVFKAVLCGKGVAIKRLQKDTLSTAATLKNEVDILSRFRHPNLVTLIGHTDLSLERPCIIYELMIQGSLRDRLSCLENTPPLPWDIRIRIVHDISCSIRFLHRPYSNAPLTLHLDIKSDNVLLGNNFEAKLSDFGLVKSMSTDLSRTLSPSGTLGYICPEYLTDGRYSDKTDVYSFGIVLAEVLTGKTAIFSQSGGRPINLGKWIREDVVSNPSTLFPQEYLDPAVRASWPPETYQPLAKLMRKCVDGNSENRPNMEFVNNELKKIIEGKLRLCILCMENPTNAKLQCGHSALCEPCAKYLKTRGNGCPFCNAPITYIEQGVFSKTFIF